MTVISRRWFLKGALAVTAATVIPMQKVLAFAPKIYGDGIADDTEGLQALFDGKPVDILNDCVRVLTNDGVRLNGGVFRVTSTLSISRSRTNIESAKFLADSLREECPLFSLGAGNVGTSIRDVHVILRRQDAGLGDLIKGWNFTELGRPS